jgi:hypothetical protein
VSLSPLSFPDREDDEVFFSGDRERCGCVVVFSLAEGDCGASSSLGGDFFDFLGDLEKKFIEMTEQDKAWDGGGREGQAGVGQPQE